MEPDHNDEGEWKAVLLWIVIAMCLSPLVVIVIKAFWNRGAN